MSDDAALVKDLCAIEDGLTEWEMTFADSIARWVEGGRHLTQRQRETAEKILRRVKGE